MTNHPKKRRRRISTLPKPLTFEKFRTKKITQFQRERDRKKLIVIKDVNPKGRHFFMREDWEIIEQSDLKDRKAFVIERWRQVKTKPPLAHKETRKKGRVEYRISYYIVTTKNRWWFGQYATLIPEKDLRKISEAIRRIKRGAHTKNAQRRSRRSH